MIEIPIITAAKPTNRRSRYERRFMRAAYGETAPAGKRIGLAEGKAGCPRFARTLRSQPALRKAFELRIN
jgi:hypothetical protein